MSFTVGDRVRLGATFRRLNGDGISVMFDPAMITVTVAIIGGRSKRFTRSDGDVVRRSLGEWYLDVLVDAAGILEVKWASTGSGQESWQRARYEVVSDSYVGDLGLTMDDADPVEQSDADDFEPIELSDENSDRTWMIGELEAAGVPVDVSRSDAYIAAAYKAMQPRTQSPRAAYVRRQRFGQ